MSKLRIFDAPLLPDVNGLEKIPTGGRGDLAISMEQVKTFAQGSLPQQIEDHINDTENPHQVSKTQVGLGNVDNTSDVNKPISTATQEALDLKADKTAVYSKSATLPTYYTKEVGVNPVAGVADGAYFNVRSSSDESYVDEYQNIGGSAVATGKSYLSAYGVQQQEKAAGTISDALGVSQQKINDGLESIAELRNTNPPRKGLRVYVKSWHEGLALGGDIFVATQKVGLVDNGVTVFSSQNPLIFWVRLGVREVTPFMAGAKGDRVQDDQPAFMSALAAGFPVKVEDSPNGYRLNAPVSLADGQTLIGDKKRIQVYVDHVGACFKLTKNCTLKNFSPRPFDSAREYNFDGLEVGESGSSVSFTFNNIDNIKPFFPRNGFVLRGWVFWNTFLNIDCYKFRDNGILLANDTEGKNNNYFQFKQLSSNAQAESDGSYKYLDVTWEQCAIRVNGNQNIFIGGEPAPSKWGVWIDGTSSGNRFQTMYGEHQLHPIKTFAGSENFYDSTCAQGTPQIHPDSIIYGQSGKDNTRYARLGIAPIAAQKDLKGLWFFNEGFGTKILDHSGNKKHLTAINPNWTNEGRWGKTVKLDAAQTSRFADFPVDVLNWEQPFTLAACVKSPEAGSNFLITFRDVNQRYAALSTGESLAAITDYDLTKVTTTSYTRMLRSPQDGYVWVIMHFDPINKTITALDPERGVVNARIPAPPVFSPWLAGGGAGISTITLGSRTTAGLDGSFSFLGLWQRRLNMSEVSDLVNMKVPNLFPSAAPARISDQADSAATDVDTLKADFNALLAKMRDAGIML